MDRIRSFNLGKVLIEAKECKFVFISGMGWIIDFSVFYLLNNLKLDAALANMISASLGVTVVFVFSTRHIFENAGGSLFSKYKIYLGYQVVSIYLISNLIRYLALYLSVITMNYQAIFAKLIVTPITLIANYIFMRILIEKISLSKERF